VAKQDHHIRRRLRKRLIRVHQRGTAGSAGRPTVDATYLACSPRLCGSGTSGCSLRLRPRLRTTALWPDVERWLPRHPRLRAAPEASRSSGCGPGLRWTRSGWGLRPRSPSGGRCGSSVPAATSHLPSTEPLAIDGRWRPTWLTGHNRRASLRATAPSPWRDRVDEPPTSEVIPCSWWTTTLASCKNPEMVGSTACVAPEPEVKSVPHAVRHALAGYHGTRFRPSRYDRPPGLA
jgi:hypothetical protein